MPKYFALVRRRPRRHSKGSNVHSGSTRRAWAMAKFDNLSKAERIGHAKTKMEKVLDHFMYLLELHENNAIIVYSNALSSQIPHSFAANAFNVFQRGMHQFEIVR